MSMSYFQPFNEHVLEWVILLSAVAAWISALALAVIMVVGRWRLALHQRKMKRRHSVLHDDVLDSRGSSASAGRVAGRSCRSSGQRTDTA
jgi:hypothetical protein